MPGRTRCYVAGAFLVGVVLTAACNKGSLFPRARAHDADAKQRRKPVAGSAKEYNLDAPENISVDSLEKKNGHIKEGIEGCIGNTPLIKIKSLSDYTGCEILAKAEFLNGAGNSPKDRVALSIIELAEEKGLLVPDSGDTIYEGTVGSTGISLAAICRARGYKAHICMPNDMAIEKSDLLLKLGAEVERVRPAPIVDQNQFVNLARARATEHTASSEKSGRGLFADQFENEANWRAHFTGTGPEIYTQTDGQLDAFVSGAGTGGTISGVALFLKSKIPEVKIVLADPPGSGLFNRVKFGVMFDPKEREGTRRRHQVDTIVEGIGINRVTHNFDVGRELIDDAIRVNDEQAINMARWLVEHDGIFVGSSSAVNCVAATKLATILGPGHRIVTILCDSGARHLSKFWKNTEPVGGAINDVSLDKILSV
ncbi:tryptophan synthase beta subunit-like PLP-dependent enzyme [Ampelomyces quisqualis]|uniref:Cysteine synthase 2 n=1 Tax=Ampelomyces quisqualis TaxID=50730 RepID=A0A6A5Q9K8_AMPQU|nr:tryptophan synthase beta subunit-like PLP-dependent enzyme [Ampelomyces quisqualis]